MARLQGLVPLLKTDNIRKTIDFYSSILGFATNGAWPEGNPTWCMLENGCVHLMFYHDDHHDPSPPKLTGRLYIYTDDVLGLYEQIKDRVQVVDRPEIYHYGMHEFAIRDCNGYELSFGQPTDAPPTCPAP